MKSLLVLLATLAAAANAQAAPVTIDALPEPTDISSAYESSITQIAISLKSDMPTNRDISPGIIENRYVAFEGTAAELTCSVVRGEISSVGSSICKATFNSELSTPELEISVPAAAQGKVIQATFRNASVVSAIVGSSIDLKMGLATESKEKALVTFENGKTAEVPRLQMRCPDARVGKAPTSCVLTGVLN